MVTGILVVSFILLTFAALMFDSGKLFRIGLVLLLMGTLAYIYQAFFIETYKEPEKSMVPLITLKDNSLISGQISMVFGNGNGEVKETYYYTMYYSTKKGGAKFLKLPVNEVDIVFSDNKRLLIVKDKIVPVFKYWIDQYVYIPCGCEKEKYILEIPKNSIDNTFILNAE